MSTQNCSCDLNLNVLFSKNVFDVGFDPIWCGQSNQRSQTERLLHVYTLSKLPFCVVIRKESKERLILGKIVSLFRPEKLRTIFFYLICIVSYHHNHSPGRGLPQSRQWPWPLPCHQKLLVCFLRTYQINPARPLNQSKIFNSAISGIICVPIIFTHFDMSMSCQSNLHYLWIYSNETYLIFAIFAHCQCIPFFLWQNNENCENLGWPTSGQPTRLSLQEILQDATYLYHPRHRQGP